MRNRARVHKAFARGRLSEQVKIRGGISAVKSVLTLCRDLQNQKAPHKNHDDALWVSPLRKEQDKGEPIKGYQSLNESSMLQARLSSLLHSPPRIFSHSSTQALVRHQIKPQLTGDNVIRSAILCSHTGESRWRDRLKCVLGSTRNRGSLACHKERS
jgi:hypothetical protein